KLEIDILRFTTEFNLGYSYFIFQDYHLSLTHIENCLNYIPPEYIADTLLSYCILIKCNIELENFDKANEWKQKGSKLIEDKNLNMNSPTNHAFKEAYIEFVCLTHFLNGEYEDFENMTLNNLIPRLEIDNNFFEIGYYYGH